MEKYILIALIICVSIPDFTIAQAAKSANSDIKNVSADEQLRLRIDCFAQLVNATLKGEADESQLSPSFMDEDDLNYWMGQFEFTDEVLKEISREGFYNRLQGWAESAKLNFLSSLQGTDGFEIMSYQFKYGDDPGLRVSKSANLFIQFTYGDEIVNRMQITLIDIRGQLKFIQAN